tara:strand:- start:1074 stop:1679 length:606 start_codon:yes stop_codon:yes gene_type:complete
MPIDPVTGENLPYPGEPGGPPAGAPAAGAPPAGDVEQMDQMMSDDAAARAEAIASSAPPPKSPFSFQAIKSLIDEFNKTIDSLGGEDLPEVEFEAPDGEKRWNQPLPPAIFVPVVALLEALKMIDDGGMFDKYGFDPEELVDDTSLRKAAGQLKRMAKDKKLADMMQRPIGGPGEEEAPGEPMPPAPGGMEGDDAMLASEM